MILAAGWPANSLPAQTNYRIEALTPENIANLLQYALVAWIALLAGFAFYAILVKSRAFEEMMTGTSGAFDPERVGAIFVVLLVAGYYVLTALNTPPEQDALGAYWMPDIPESLLIVLAGSKSLYIAGKIARKSH